MRRIALFSDVHANLEALDAVLGDIAAADVEEVYCLGDLVGYGPDPSGVVERIRSLGIPTIMGNYDEGIGNRRGECGCYYATEQAKSDGAASYAFTDAALDDTDHEWLATLLSEIRLEHEGARILLAHGSPRKINEYLLLDRQDAQLIRLADAAEADVVCVGHVHIPYHRVMTTEGGRSVHYISSGSVGKPKDGDPRAAWVELVVGASSEVRAAASDDDAAAGAGSADAWLGVVIHRVAYDIESVAQKMAEAGLPLTLAEALRRG
ncbi:MAG: metallophosphoesterase family protein [Coriobacteriia bacterium]|nr:metallophosphoesterase family protein [Coriobacteriia bacterium]